MHIMFVEKVLTDGSYEISVVEGSKELKKVIAGEFTLPKKLILTKQQKEENKDGLKDHLYSPFSALLLRSVFWGMYIRQILLS